MDSTEVIEQWANRSGAYSPRYYAHYGPDETSELIYDALEPLVARDGPILELGCSSGRHLSYLDERGYENLHGIEINGEAIEVMKDAYPDLAANGTFHVDTIENVVPELDDGRYDAVYSVETLQHLHPDSEWVFEELTRITDALLITVENEGGGDAKAKRDDNTEAERDVDAGTERNDVNYVDGEFPLYYRNWGRIFTERGLTEIRSRPTSRDTFRAFRTDRS